MECAKLCKCCLEGICYSFLNDCAPDTNIEETATTDSLFIEIRQINYKSITFLTNILFTLILLSILIFFIIKDFQVFKRKQKIRSQVFPLSRLLSASTVRSDDLDNHLNIQIIHSAKPKRF